MSLERGRVERTDDSAILLQIARMERPWGDVRLAGMGVVLTEQGYAATPARPLAAVATLADLARGLLRYETDREQYRGWAFVMLIVMDFTPEDHPDYDTLLDALHDASFGEPLGEEAIAAARRLAAR